MTRLAFVDEVRKVLDRAGLPAREFAGHSFRIGAASTAAAAGLEDSTIQTLGRWRSAAYLLYIRTNPSQLAKVAAVLSKCNI